MYKNLTGDFKGTFSVKPGTPNYITDTDGDPENLCNMKVSDRTTLNVDESQARDFVNYEAYVVDRLMTNFVNGTGAENYNFPTNGILSSKFLDSDIFKEALVDYKVNRAQGVSGIIVDQQYEFKAPELTSDAARNGTLFSITGMVGPQRLQWCRLIRESR